MTSSARIAVDAMGGDEGLAVMLAGVARARHRFEGMRFLLVGDEAAIREGLKSHPNHALVAAQQAGPGAMLSFELQGGTDAVRDLVETLEIFTLAESLGGVESLIAHPATMTHAAMTPEQRATAGIGDGLVRLSVGLEHVEDLIADLFPALDALVPATAAAA